MKTPPLLAFQPFAILFAVSALASVLQPPPETAETLTIAAVGDVLLHAQLQKQAYAKGFPSLWRQVTPLLKGADVAYANLEGPLAGALDMRGQPVKDPGLKFDGKAYTGFPTFNYHPQLASELRRAGFTVVSTANNHAMDRHSLGVDRTIEALDDADLAYTGTRTRKEADADKGDYHWHTITRAKGWTVAWVACTFSTNGLPDRHHQVLRCFEDQDIVISEVKRLSRDRTVDAVIVTPHWGEVEYRSKVEDGQRELAHRFAEAGATALIGNHPHVTKPREEIATHDGRKVPVVYSIGNFVSAQDTLAERTSAIVYFDLVHAARGKVAVKSVRYVPLWMLRHPYSVVPADTSVAAPAGSISLLEKLLGKTGRVKTKANPVAGAPAPGLGEKD